ncbi:MAG: transcription antitermination factor NusB, partial [bacterium]
EHWSLERLSKVDKSLIYLGCSEIELSQTPASVVIDEMVELAKVYGDKNSPSFINGVIDSWRKKR